MFVWRRGVRASAGGACVVGQIRGVAGKEVGIVGCLGVSVRKLIKSSPKECPLPPRKHM